MTFGIQGSGKSTWAKDYVKKNKNTVRVNNDQLRLMMFDRVFDENDTKYIDSARELLIESFLEKGMSVIVDNMNLSPKHELRYRQMAEKYKIIFEIKDFTGVPLQICIDRDKRRENPVGEKTIRKMYKQFIEKKPLAIKYNTNLCDAIICDMDQTLAFMCNRSPFEEEKCIDDYLNTHLLDILDCMRFKSTKTTFLIIMSGRDEGRGRDATEKWLKKYGIDNDFLYMRKAGDCRPDDIIKEELYDEHVKGKYNIIAVFDDRLRVCKLWYRLGLPLFRVGDPESDF